MDIPTKPIRNNGEESGFPYIALFLLLYVLLVFLINKFEPDIIKSVLYAAIVELIALSLCTIK